MKILFITHKYPPSVGGMEKHCFKLIEGISKDHECLIHAYDADQGSKFGFFLNLKRNIKALLAAHPDIDVIYLNDGLMVAFTLWLKHLTDIPVVASFHGLDVLFPLSFYQKRILPRFKYLSKLIAVSAHTAKALEERKLPKERIVSIKNGVDLPTSQQVFSTQQKQSFRAKYLPGMRAKKVLLMVGRPVKRKGMSWFVDQVMRNLDDSYHLVIAGSFDRELTLPEKINTKVPKGIQRMMNLFFGLPDDKAMIRRLKLESGLNSKLTLLPRLTDEELACLYQVSSAFVMPNIKVEGDAEGFGLVALEASINGLPVFCAGIEGIQDAIIDGCNGCHVETEDAQAWVEKLELAFSDVEHLTKQAQAFRLFTVENYSWEKMNADYISVFENLERSKQVNQASTEFAY